MNYGTMNRGLLDIERGSISCDNVTFENITRLSGDGTIFEFTSLSTSISLSNMTFNNCRCMNGSGGAISVTFSSSSHKLTLSSLTFTACSASGYGGGVYIDGWSYISTNTLSSSSLYIHTNEEDEEIVTSLISSLIPFTPYIAPSTSLHLIPFYFSNSTPLYNNECRRECYIRINMSNSFLFNTIYFI